MPPLGMPWKKGLFISLAWWSALKWFLWWENWFRISLNNWFLFPLDSYFSLSKKKRPKISLTIYSTLLGLVKMKPSNKFVHTQTDWDMDIHKVSNLLSIPFYSSLWAKSSVAVMQLQWCEKNCADSWRPDPT